MKNLDSIGNESSQGIPLSRRADPFEIRIYKIMGIENQEPES